MIGKGGGGFAEKSGGVTFPLVKVGEGFGVCNGRKGLDIEALMIAVVSRGLNIGAGRERTTTGVRGIVKTMDMLVVCHQYLVL